MAAATSSPHGDHGHPDRPDRPARSTSEIGYRPAPGRSMRAALGDIDLDAAQLVVRWQASKPARPTAAKTSSPSTPKRSPCCAGTAPGSARIASPPAPPGSTTAWFSPVTGQVVHPADVTDHFQHRAHQARQHTQRHESARRGNAAARFRSSSLEPGSGMKSLAASRMLFLDPCERCRLPKLRR